MCLYGTEGCHCCLWCEITSAQLKIPRARRQGINKRTLETLRSDHDGYKAGGDKHVGYKAGGEKQNCITTLLAGNDI